MKNFILISTIVFTFLCQSKANDSIYNFYLKFNTFYTNGDLINAENCMLQVLKLKRTLPNDYLVAAYNNLGLINTLLGKYKESLDYYNLAEEIVNNKESTKPLADIYLNKARLYNIQKSFPEAIEYLEKGLRIYQDIYPDKSVLYSLSVAHLNMGISYFGIKDYQTAFSSFKKISEKGSTYSLPLKPLAYLNIANVYVKTGDSTIANEFFLKSIGEFTRIFGADYYIIADVLFDYSIFLNSQGREKEALDYQTKALEICLKNFGTKHPNVSLAYKYIGDHYSKNNEYTSALEYYQKALIALVRNFNNQDIYSNPSLDSAFLDVDLLKILQEKSVVIEKLAFQQENTQLRIQTMLKSFETIELALQLIDKLRYEYISLESRLYLMDNEKETYFIAIQIAQNLYNLSGNPAYQIKLYNFANQSKSSILRQEISDNELFSSFGMPDTLKMKYQKVLSDIAGYNHLIHEEIKSSDPDNQKVDFWKDALFKMNREKEEIDNEINNNFPQYSAILKKTEPISSEQIQKRLNKNETIVEYFLSNQYSNGRRKLCTFIVTRDSLYFHESYLDSLFSRDVNTISRGSLELYNNSDGFNKYAFALYNLYDKLIRPVENKFAGKRLIIIPDEEIAFIPFDAIINILPDAKQTSFESLNYLIKDYSISYGYSSSMIFNEEKNKIKSKVYAFAPDYNDNSFKEEGNYGYLISTTKEIESVYKRFRGTKYSGNKASESNFKMVMQHPAIFHLAMHSQQDTTNSNYSFLIFSRAEDTINDGKMYNYEIGLSRINSPMVVLSACNTGLGTLHHGEGVMSLARGFILAGASSVIKTLWDVNDDISSGIITDFYHYLSLGKAKDEALRMAKLEYLKNSPPTYSNPYYWAAYQVMGDISPVSKSRKGLYYSLAGVVIILAGAGVFYLKRRKIFAARS